MIYQVRVNGAVVAETDNVLTAIAEWAGIVGTGMAPGGGVLDGFADVALVRVGV